MQTSRTAVFPAIILPLWIVLAGCGSPQPGVSAEVAEEPEAIARTEFTDRVENFFEYDALQAGKASQFLIHLTNLADGSPVENATVTLWVRRRVDAGTVSQTAAKPGKVTGIYVADVLIQERGTYDIEFHIKNASLDERMLLSSFEVE